ncbi:MAG: hypothetical protein M3069_21345, partial [Chloroflexota bacterium]|nr:hypothetical protein [Chloroflexota bacterium]
QLPQLWYQIGLKFRDEPRPKSGLLRVREFLMKDAYSFDLDAAGLDRSFAHMRATYERIYARCELEALPAEAFSGAMGGRESIEFVVCTPAGEDMVLRCQRAGTWPTWKWLAPVWRCRRMSQRASPLLRHSPRPAY